MKISWKFGSKLSMKVSSGTWSIQLEVVTSSTTTKHVKTSKKRVLFDCKTLDWKTQEHHAQPAGVRLTSRGVQERTGLWMS